MISQPGTDLFLERNVQMCASHTLDYTTELKDRWMLLQKSLLPMSQLQEARDRAHDARICRRSSNSALQQRVFYKIDAPVNVGGTNHPPPGASAL